MRLCGVRVLAVSDICTFMKWCGGAMIVRACLGAAHELAATETSVITGRSEWDMLLLLVDCVHRGSMCAITPLCIVTIKAGRRRSRW